MTGDPTSPSGPARWRSTHLGPAPSDVGGMATVLAAYQQLGPHGHQIEVVPTYASTAPLWGLALYLRALRRLLGTPRAALGVVHVHLSRRGSFVREGSLLVLAHLKGCPTCATLHGSCFGVHFEWFRPLYLFVLRRADRVITLTDDTAALLADRLPAERLATVPNPVDAPARTSPVAASPPLAVFAGQLSRRKGFDVLLRAWEPVARRLPAAELVVVGPVSDVALPAQRRWTYAGVLDRTEVAALLQRARLGVLPSRHEAMPVFLLEAMAAGRPVVATDVAAIPSMVDGGGIIVPVEDVDALAAALVRLLEDPDVAARMGALGRARVQAHFSPAAVAEALGAVYDAVSADRAEEVATP